ncbi:MAG: hypothetical protein H8E20_03510 [Verrucomicrobia bacterium]|nr:hypothetical protein [Verrucomicrobiota bacterium]
MADNPEIKLPNEVKRILCLANSRKLSGRCIAGREIVNQQPGPWIRPVSGREHQEVSWEERHYEDGSDPSVLDVMDVPLVEPRPHQFQQENWLLDSTFYWRKTGRMDWAGLQDFVEPEGPLWVNGQHTGRGLNDRISVQDAERLGSSLRLVRINNLTIDVSCPGAAFGNPKRRLQGQFQFQGVWYHLRVTDPVYERRFLALPDAQHRLGESCLAISLGEPFEGYAYKLIAAIIERGETEKA